MSCFSTSSSLSSAVIAKEWSTNTVCIKIKNNIDRENNFLIIKYFPDANKASKKAEDNSGK